MEIIKQLYDVGGSFDQAANPVIIAQTFHAFAKTELGYRNINAETIIVLDDIHETALHISTRGSPGKGNLEALMRGITQLKQYIFSESFQIEKAITSASKAAYLSALIRTSHPSIERFTDPQEIKNWTIENQQFNKLNKLKKSNPEAFFYWYKTLDLLGMLK